jgi:hypothetical protein
MAGHGSPPAQDKAEHPGRKVARSGSMPVVVHQERQNPMTGVSQNVGGPWVPPNRGKTS